MFKTLVRLWWLQKRRMFRWKDVAVGVYLLMLYVIVLVSLYFGLRSGGGDIPHDAPAMADMVVVASLLLVDVLVKTAWKRDVAVMDDYLKTRPMPMKTWNRFLLFSNVVNGWNWMLPLCLLPVFLVISSVATALASFVVLMLFSIANGMFVTCFRRTSDLIYHLSLFGGWVMMAGVVCIFLLLFFWLPAALLELGMALLAMAVVGGLVFFLSQEENYDENRHKASRQHAVKGVTLFGMQFLGLVRAKRIRNLVLFVTLLYLFNVYLVGWPSGEELTGGMRLEMLFMVATCVLLPSETLSQWTFGIEANFFQGLMTKPVTVRQLLLNNYYFYTIISLVVALLIVPLTFISPDVTPQLILGALGMTLFVNLFNLPTCLFSTRLELFSSAFFNMQGSNTKINAFALILVVPGCIVAVIYAVWGEAVWCCACMGLGLLSLILLRPVATRVANKFYARRYDRMEAYMK